MHEQKIKITAVTPLILGPILALLSFVYPVMILFIIPSVIIFIGTSKIFKKITVFLLSFLLIYTPLIYYQKISPEDTLLTTYNILKNNVIDTNLGDIKMIEGFKLIDNFDKDDGRYKLIKNNQDATMGYTTQGVYEGEKALELTIKLPTTAPIRIQTEKDLEKIREYTNSNDWKDYDFINIWIKNDCGMGWFGIILTDEDGDLWQYHDDQILKKKEWTLLKVPIKSLKTYDSSHGNGKFDRIVQYILNFDSYVGKKGSCKIDIDKMYLSKI